MPFITTQQYLSPVGELTLGTFDNQLCLCNWHNKKNKAAVQRRLFKHFKAILKEGDNAILEATVSQLDAYFSGHKMRFEIPIITAGTDFQKQVWEALQSVKYAQTISYSTLAQKIDHPNAVRAVANANAANALSIIIPCHRIIGHSGKLVGYAGGLDTKQRLLEREQAA